MLSITQLKTILSQHLSCPQIEVESDGRHWFVTLISNDFRLLNRLQRHRKVYAILAQQLANEEIHALSLKTYTEEEWQSLKSTPST